LPSQELEKMTSQGGGGGKNEQNLTRKLYNRL
jgi:hypothetical protein